MFSQVIAVAKSSDIVLMVLDASKVSAIWLLQ
jgi:ribosome-interacting GTPase 1